MSRPGIGLLAGLLLLALPLCLEPGRLTLPSVLREAGYQGEILSSNWQAGRLFGRGGILSGDSVFTVRLRAEIRDRDLHR